MIHTQKPPKFNPVFEVVSCFIEHDGEVLFIKRHPEKREGDKWGVPAGKVDKDESLENALIREIQEETQISLSRGDLEYKEVVYIRYPDIDYIYHMYIIKHSERPDVNLKLDEATEYRWLKPKDALHLPLVLDEDECIKRTYSL